jgi:two-component system sensor histidine kinase/response regulator
MPVMDGFAATRAIRRKEKSSGAHLPIIAMTAHAMKGDRERCLKVGMDAYVGKPIRAEELLLALEQSAAPLASDASPNSAPESPDALFDQAELLARTGGDRKLLRKLVELVSADSEETLARLRNAVAQKDAQTLFTAAHALKGGLATLAAHRASGAALQLEKMGRAGKLHGAADLLAVLKKETAQALRSLRKFASLDGAAPPPKRPARNRKK